MNPADVSAKLSYLIPTNEKPIYIASTGGADARLDIGAEFEEHCVKIGNARRLSPPATLDTNGFALVEHPTKVRDFYQLDAQREDYEREISQLVLAASGGSEAIVFDHTLRSDSDQVRGNRTSREPASVVHNDYTDASAAKRLREIVPMDSAEQWLQGRFAIINLWRTARSTVINSPLACCNAMSLEEKDLVSSERRAEDRIGELQLVTWNPRHRWFFFPEMTSGEALLIKTFDSVCDGRARRSIHTAFDNPAAPADAPPRESIESRLLVKFD